MQPPDLATFGRGTAIALAVLALSATALLPTGASRAQGKDPIALFNEASDLADKGQYEEAIAIWLMVADAIPEKYRPVVQVNLGLAYKKLGKHPQAYHHLSRYLAAKPGDPDASGWLAEIKGLLAKTHVLCHVKCTPADARVFVQGESKDGYACPLDWWFEPGRRLVRAEKEGFEQKLEVVEVPAGKGELDVQVVLAATEQWGYLEVHGEGKSIQVFLDGMLEGKVPFRRKLKPGSYELMVGRPGELPWKKRVTVNVGETLVEKPDIAAPEEKPPQETLATQLGTPVHVAAKAENRAGAGPWWKWTLVGAGAVAAATGGALGYLAMERNEQLKRDFPDGTPESPAPIQHRELYDQAYDDEVRPKIISSYALYGVGGAMAVAGGILLLVGEGEQEPAANDRFGLTPALLPDGAAMTFSISW
jgi:tetratricopeptide (TPR) repeat protein